MNRSIRCAHGFDRAEVPCEECGDNPRKLPKGRSTRPHVSMRSEAKVPPGYARADGRHHLAGNCNAKVRY